jgi:hypothetical protein
MNAFRDVRLCDQILSRGKQRFPPLLLPTHEEDLRSHEDRIHNAPCSCGSGRRYVDCCIGRADQDRLEERRLQRAIRRW